MEAGLAAQHPEIQTYEGVCSTTRRATLRADTAPLGFHASVRSDDGDWYIDPYYKDDTSAYVSYYGHDLVNQHGSFVEPEGADATSFDPFDIGAKSAALAGTPVQLRTYRLALVTDPSYATYWGAANVTAAKVTLINRVDQFYEDETAIRLVLINDLDKINLNTDAQATGANGPCGAAACYTTSQLSTCGSSTLSRNRIVLGQIIGASNYDIGHIGLGKSGRRHRLARRRRRQQQGAGLHRRPDAAVATTTRSTTWRTRWATSSPATTPSTARRATARAATATRARRSSRAPARRSWPTPASARRTTCSRTSDPYWSQRSFDEITTYTSTPRPNINEVQTASLVGFDGTDSFILKYGSVASDPIVRGTNYTAAGIAAALQGPSEVQQVSLTGYDADGDSYTLGFNGGTSVPIIRGQNNTAAGITAALQGGNEQQTVTLTGFNPATQSLQIARPRRHDGHDRRRRRGVHQRRHRRGHQRASSAPPAPLRWPARRPRHRLHGDVQRRDGQHRRRGASRSSTAPPAAPPRSARPSRAARRSPAGRRAAPSRSAPSPTRATR